MKKKMLRNLILAFISSLFFMQGLAQNTNSSDLKPEDMRKLLEQQKKEIEADQDMDPEEKEKVLHLLDGANSKKINDAKKEDLSGRSTNPIPKKATLASMSKKILTDGEVENLVHEMIKKLEPQIPVNEKKFVNAAISKSGGNSVALSNMAVATWYTGHAKAALMTALKAAVLPHPEAALNNVAAILNLSGYEEKAAPVLLNLLSKYPNNSTVLNNLGQAFYGLGDNQKATTYFLQCIKKSPNHPEACNTMALIFLKAGNSKAALDYLEQSLKGGYNRSARNALEQQKPDYDFIPIDDNHFARPADLPDLDIQMPPLPYDVYTVDDVQNKHDIFQHKIEEICYGLDDKISEEEAKYPMQILEQAKVGKSAPFAGVGLEMFAHYTAVYGKTMFERSVQESNLQADIRAKYEPMVNAIMKDNSGNYCKKLNKVRSQKQNEISSQYKEYIKDNLEIARQYLDKSLRVLPLMAVCPAAYNAEFYTMLRTYIWEYHALSHGASFFLNCEGTGKASPYDYKPDLNLHPACRYKVVIPFIIGSMKFDCSTFEFEGGELLKLGVKRDFITNQTTLAIGVGVGIKTPITELGAQQSFYISFDSDQQPTDIGMKGEVKGSVGAGITSETGLEYTMGMNSGIDVSATLGGQAFKL